MADYYSIATAQVTVPWSDADFHALGNLITEEVLDDGGEPAFHGYSVEYYAGEVYLFTGGEDSAQEAHLPKRFLTRLGQVLKEAEMPFLEVGVAFVSNELGPDSQWGYPFSHLSRWHAEIRSQFFHGGFNSGRGVKVGGRA